MQVGEVRMYDDIKQTRLVVWDWEYILVDDNGCPVEGDVCKVVKRRVTEIFWEQHEERGSAKREAMGERWIQHNSE